MTLTRPRLALALALCAAGLTGCISYRLDRLPEARALPTMALDDARPSLVYAITSSVSADSTHAAEGLPATLPSPPFEEFASALIRSGWFRSVDASAPGREGDLRIDIVVVEHANDVVLLASMCTLTIIPMWRTVTWDLSAEVRARDGSLHRYELNDAARDILWLPLVLGMSFRPWGEAYGEVRANLYRTLLLRIHDDGLLAAPRTPQPPR